MFSRRNNAFFIVHFACFSLLRFVLLDCQVCLVKRFVVFIIFAALRECCFRFWRQTVLFYFCCVRHLMWAEGVSMSFCGGNKPMDFCCFVLQQMLKPLLHDKISVLAELFVVVCVWLRCFYLCLCYLSLCARTQNMQNCANRIDLCVAKPTVALFVATIFHFSARLSVKDLPSCAAESDDSV